MKIQLSVKEFQDLNELKNPSEANGIINFLVKQGLATLVGTRRTTSGRGKPAKLYEIEQNVNVKLFEDDAQDLLDKWAVERAEKIAAEKTKKAEKDAEKVTVTKTVKSETQINDDEDLGMEDHLDFEEYDEEQY
jgi:hypothetical protein